MPSAPEKVARQRRSQMLRVWCRVMLQYCTIVHIRMAGPASREMGCESKGSMETPGDIADDGNAVNALLAGLPPDLLDLLPIGIYLCDRHGRILRYSRGAATLWQRTPELNSEADRFCGSYQLYRIDGTPLPHADSPLAGVLAAGTSVRNSEIVMARGDGSRIVALLSIDPLKDPAGTVTGAIACFRDITELHQRRFAADEGEQGGPDLLSSVAAAVYTTNAQGRITYYNEAAADLWGLRPELGVTEFCGSWKLYAPNGQPLPHGESAMAVTLRERHAVHGSEAIAERPDGSRVHFMPFPAPLYDHDGTFIGAISSISRTASARIWSRSVRPRSNLHSTASPTVSTECLRASKPVMRH